MIVGPKKLHSRVDRFEVWMRKAPDESDTAPNTLPYRNSGTYSLLGAVVKGDQCTGLGAGVIVSQNFFLSRIN